MYLSDLKTGKHHHTRYYQGRRHVIFIGRVIRIMRVFPSSESKMCHREVYYR